MLDIDMDKYLTQEQKSAIGTAIFDKLITQIEAIEFTKVKVNMKQDIEQELVELFNAGDLYDNVNFGKIGQALTKKILENI